MRLLLVGLVASLVLAIAWRAGAELSHRAASVDTAPTTAHDAHRSAALPARVGHALASAFQARRATSLPPPDLSLAVGATTLSVLLAWVLAQSSRAASLHRRVVLAPLPSRAPPRRR